jgi:hypothetical protein
MVCQFKNGMVCLPLTSEAGARWPRRGLVVDATTNRRDNKVQMIRPIVLERLVLERLVLERLVLEHLVLERLVLESLVLARLVLEHKSKTLSFRTLIFYLPQSWLQLKHHT